MKEKKKIKSFLREGFKRVGAGLANHTSPSLYPCSSSPIRSQEFLSAGYFTAGFGAVPHPLDLAESWNC